jgi:hypothetical protein
MEELADMLRGNRELSRLLSNSRRNETAQAQA